MSHALLLNASFEPLHIVSWQKAIQLLFQGKVEVVEESDQIVRSVRVTIRVPAVVRLVSYIPIGKRRNMIKFSRSNIFLRDRHECQYCGQRFPKQQLTLDHVRPIVQGGGKSWENIVSCCKSCNQRKGGRTPDQAGMKLIAQPRRPNWLPGMSLQLGVTWVPPTWKVYFRFET